MTDARPIPEVYAEAVRRSETCGLARLLDIRVTEIEGGRVRVAMPTAGKENAHGTTHGGAIFAVADHAFGIAANLNGVDQIAISAYIQYLSVPAEGTLEAVAWKVSETEKTSLYTVEVFSGERRIATFEGVGFKTGVYPRPE